MGVTRHDCFGVLVSDVAEHPNQGNHQLPEFSDSVAQVKSDIQRHLVVPRTGSVQALSDVAEPLGEFRLNEHVDILSGHVELQFAAFDIRQDLLQSADKLQAVAHADYALFAEHCRMCDTALDILLIHSSVERDRGIERVHSAVNALGGTSCPHHFCHKTTSFFLFLSFCNKRVKSGKVSFPPLILLRGKRFRAPARNYFLFLSASRRALTWIGRPNRLMNPAESFWS